MSPSWLEIQRCSSHVNSPPLTIGVTGTQSGLQVSRGPCWHICMTERSRGTFCLTVRAALREICASALTIATSKFRQAGHREVPPFGLSICLSIATKDLTTQSPTCAANKPSSHVATNNQLLFAPHFPQTNSVPPVTVFLAEKDLPPHFVQISSSPLPSPSPPLLLSSLN